MADVGSQPGGRGMMPSLVQGISLKANVHDLALLREEGLTSKAGAENRLGTREACARH